MFDFDVNVLQKQQAPPPQPPRQQPSPLQQHPAKVDSPQPQAPLPQPAPVNVQNFNKGDPAPIRGERPPNVQPSPRPGYNKQQEHQENPNLYSRQNSNQNQNRPQSQQHGQQQYQNQKRDSRGPQEQRGSTPTNSRSGRLPTAGEGHFKERQRSTNSKKTLTSL